MPKKGENMHLRSYDEIFSTQEDRDAGQGAGTGETVQQIPLSELHPFEGHPFRVVDDDSMKQTVESISQFGVVTPLLARPDPDGGYEIISGHRRCHAAELLGLETMPVIVREMDDDTAIITMVDSNLQREEILPSERAWAYKMKLDAIKHQGAKRDRTPEQTGQRFSDSTSRPVVGKLEAADLVGETTGDSGRQVQRFIRLTELAPDLMDMVDEKKIGVRPAVELSYLSRDEQKGLLEAMDYAQATPSLAQAQRLKKMSQEGTCTSESMFEILSEEKKGDMERVTFKTEDLRKYFPKSYTSQQMEDTIIRLLEQWQKKRSREQNR